MRRVVAGAITIGALAFPGPAAAHTLSIGAARGETLRWARTLVAATEAYAWGVGDCRRINAHNVDCPWWSKVAGRNGGAAIHCDYGSRVTLGPFDLERRTSRAHCHVEGYGGPTG